MLKKSKIAICLLCMVSLVVLIPFESKASDKVYNVIYPEPSADSNNGYIVVETSDSKLYTIFWNTGASAADKSVDSSMNLTVTSTYIRFAPYGSAVASGGPLRTWSISMYDNVGNLTFLNSNTSLTGSYYQYNIPSGSIVGLYYKGNVSKASDDYSYPIDYPVPSVVFSSQNQSASQQQEKEEATEQGSSSVSSGTDSIDDKGASFAQALGGFVSALTTNETYCSWTFPKVELPAIPGVMDSVVLIESQPIPLSAWLLSVPNNVLILIQAFFTCTLIVFCFKELYSTISYVLTLKGGGADE